VRLCSSPLHFDRSSSCTAPATPLASAAPRLPASGSFPRSGAFRRLGFLQSPSGRSPLTGLAGYEQDELEWRQVEGRKYPRGLPEGNGCRVLVPVSLPSSNVSSERVDDSVIESLNFSVSLRVIGSGKYLGDFEFSADRQEELRIELRPIIGQ
jgi:hypothetical protein